MAWKSHCASSTVSPTGADDIEKLVDGSIVAWHIEQSSYQSVVRAVTVLCKTSSVCPLSYLFPPLVTWLVKLHPLGYS